MPDDHPVSPPPPQPWLTRRAGLLAAVLAVPFASAAACSTSASDGARETAAGDTSASDGGDDQAIQEAGLVARYDAVIAAFPGTTAVALLTELRDQHAAHRDALGGAEAVAPTSPVPESIDAALADLTATERAASRARIRACVATDDPERARLLAFIAASEASHVPALRDVGGTS